MLFFITGASGSGKTSCIPSLKKLLPKATIVDFDDIGVPENPDKQWRQAATEKWLRRYLDEANEDLIFCICGQVVLGEILACPSAKQVGKVNLCLLDVSDIERIKRLKQHNTYGADQNMLNWAAWLRMHHIDPQWHQGVIKEKAWAQLNFSCWDAEKNWSQLANVTVIDNTHLTLEGTAQSIKDWINLNNENSSIKKLLLSPLTSDAIEEMVWAFKKIAWNKPKTLFEKYFQEQIKNERSVFVAKIKDHFAGYITLKWQSDYAVFFDHNIPEIVDLNVLPHFRRQGIGTALINACEHLAQGKGFKRIGLGVSYD